MRVLVLTAKFKHSFRNAVRHNPRLQRRLEDVLERRSPLRRFAHHICKKRRPGMVGGVVAHPAPIR